LQLVHESADQAGIYARIGTFLADENEESYIAFLKQKGYRYIGSTFVREPVKRDQSKKPNDDIKHD
jgi:hypothetical protein